MDSENKNKPKKNKWVPDSDRIYEVKIKLDKNGYLILAEQSNRFYDIKYTKEGKADISQLNKQGKVINHLVCSKKSIFTYMKILTGTISLYEVVGNKIKQNNMGRFKRFIRKILVNLKYKINDLLDRHF